MVDLSKLPSYQELLEGYGTSPKGASWSVFGEGDQLGTVNFLTPDRAKEALKSVQRGKTINLDYPINAFVPSIAGTRPETRHTIFSNNPNHRDDWLDSFYLQSTSQIDGLRHIRHPQYGFYGAVPDERIAVGTPDLGIQLFAERGIVGRGVLFDVQRFFVESGREYDVTTTVRITSEDMEKMAAKQNVDVRPGDIVLLHFGWAERYLASSLEERAAMKGKPGLDQSHDVLAWLWNNQIALIAADNSGVEAIPVDTSSEWYDPEEPPPARGPSHNGLMHRPMIALLGMVLGELWKLDELAAYCAQKGQYEFLVVAKPLNLVGGVGSPPNAVAIL